jgi:hypothetical protein
MRDVAGSVRPSCLTGRRIFGRLSYDLFVIYDIILYIRKPEQADSAVTPLTHIRDSISNLGSDIAMTEVSPQFLILSRQMSR